MPNENQEPSASLKVPNQDFKYMEALCTIKISLESKNQDLGSAKGQETYQNQDQDAKQ